MRHHLCRLRVTLNLLVLALPASGLATSDEATSRRITRREREVLRLLADGKTDREIAAELCISHRTVTTHAHHLFAKLGVRNRVQAATAALLAGLL